MFPGSLAVTSRSDPGGPVRSVVLASLRASPIASLIDTNSPIHVPANAPGNDAFLAGVIEGFYGPPWTQTERSQLFDWMAAWGLNTYLYCPKDDLKHRAVWRECYTEAEAAPLQWIIDQCTRRGLRCLYAIGPGLDIRYSHAPDLDSIRGRFDQLLSMGCRDFALLFDDIPDRMDPIDLARWGSLAAAQSWVTNEVYRWLQGRSPGSRLLFCPTPYCSRMARANHGGEGYLETIGRDLLPGIDVFWTGPEIISREITVGHVTDLASKLRRPPVIWDNLYANDYDGRRFYCGPYSGRPPELKRHVRGLLTNPNNEFAVNFIPFRTLARFVANDGPWEPRAEFLRALTEWQPHFATTGAPLASEDLTRFADCFYLPYEDGPEARRLFELARKLATTPITAWGSTASDFLGKASRLREFCGRLTELRDRSLLYSMYRRIWELREELDLLEKFVRFKSTAGHADLPFHSDFHLPSTYRGSLVARLQECLEQRPDGSLHQGTPR